MPEQPTRPWARWTIMAAAVLLSLIAVPQASAEQRLALVIGNGAYVSAPQLVNPPRDAKLVAATLRRVGFTVTELVDADAQAMKRAMLQFSRTLRGSDAVGLFYYAGHGLQVSGHNYLVPVTANITDETEAAIEAVSLTELLGTMERSQSRVSIVILDACRNNPFARSFRSGQQGLARVDAPTGSFIAYATAPGSVAADGVGENSPYTRALAQVMTRPGLPLEQVFKEVRRAVLADSGGKQVPWDSSSLTGDFYFVNTGRSEPQTRVDRPPPAKSESDDKTLDLALWNEIKDRKNPALFLSYLQQFPRGTFAPVARQRLVELQAVSTTLANRPSSGPSTPGATAARWREAIPGSSQRPVTQADLSRLDCDGLWVARNELFARNGYCFGSERGQQVFGAAGCRTSDQGILSDLEKANMIAIKAEERGRCASLGGDGANVAAPTQPSVASRAISRHYVTGLDPAGDNYLSLRTKPGSGGREILRMGPNTPLEVIARQGPWLNVRLDNGTTGWAFGKYVACCR